MNKMIALYQAKRKPEGFLSMFSVNQNTLCAVKGQLELSDLNCLLLPADRLTCAN